MNEQAGSNVRSNDWPHGEARGRYEKVTRHIPELENVPYGPERKVAYARFMSECDFDIELDSGYPGTLNRHGLGHGRLFSANVESFGMEEAVAALTYIYRTQHGGLSMPNTLPPRDFEVSFTVRLLRRLAELDGTWTRPNVVAFYHEYDANGYMSNWYRAPFSFGGQGFPTSEHWMMWQKAQVFRDRATANAILEAADPAEAKQLGRGVKPYHDSIWYEACIPLMRVGLRQKFIQNDWLRNNLLSTGSAVLAEASPTDCTWGVGLGEDDPSLTNPAEWHGKNLLGRTLMDVRSDLRSLAALGEGYEWDTEILRRSHVWHMSLLELARIPSARNAALMYAAIAAQYVGHYHGTRDVLREVDAPIGGICESMGLNMGEGLPITGWGELMDELALQVRLGRV